MIEKINNHQSTAIETRHDMAIRDAWNRFVDDSYTLNDLALILDSVNDDRNLPIIFEVLKRVGDESLNISPPEAKERIEAYRKEAARIFAKYKRKQRITHSLISTRFRKIWYAAAAAALLLGLLIPAAYFYLNPKNEQTEQAVVQYVEAATGRGEIKTIFLHDQTKVTLNAESRLTYPAEFTDERSVELQGEALFEVISDSSRSFTVTTTDMKVSVLGTVFDVRAYPDDGSSSVSVASGTVEVGLRGETEKMGKTWETGCTASILLGKNHQVKMDKATGNFEKLTIDADQCLSWTDGTLYFYRTPIREVVNMFNRRFPQTDLELAEGEYANLISGKLDSKHMETVLSFIIYTTGLKHKITGNKIILYNDNHHQ